MRCEAVAVSDESTVVAEFVPEAIARDAGYQREADLEAAAGFGCPPRMT